MGFITLHRSAALVTLTGIALAALSLFYTEWLGAESGFGTDIGYKVWQLLVMLQILVWSGLAVLNLTAIRRLGILHKSPRNLGWFLFAVYGGVVAIVGAAYLIGVIAVDPSIRPAGIAIQTLGLLAVYPALRVLATIRDLAEDQQAWEYRPGSAALMRRLRRLLRAGTASAGVVIALAIVATDQISRVTWPLGDNDPPVVLLYGALFTGVLFSIYLWVSDALDRRSRRIIDRSVGPIDPDDWSRFQLAEDHRAMLAKAYGLDSSTRDSFEDLVAVATPLVASVTAFYIG